MLNPQWRSPLRLRHRPHPAPARGLIGSGAIFPILSRLKADGLVAWPPSRARQTARRRKYYEIDACGKDTLADERHQNRSRHRGSSTTSTPSACSMKTSSRRSQSVRSLAQPHEAVGRCNPTLNAQDDVTQDFSASTPSSRPAQESSDPTAKSNSARQPRQPERGRRSGQGRRPPTSVAPPAPPTRSATGGEASAATGRCRCWSPCSP